MSPKGGLGRGLNALLPGENLPGSESGASYAPVERIQANPQQPRHSLPDQELEELAQSIREHGILQPLVVTYHSESNTYTLIAGERRLRAAILAGMNTVPVVVRQATEQQRLELALIENIQRSNLSALETAEAYLHLQESFGLSQEDIAAKVGKDRVTVANTLRLLKLTESVKTALTEGKISEGHARALLGLNSAPSQAAALQTVLSQNLSVRQTEDLVRKLTGIRPESNHPIKEELPEIRDIEDRLFKYLGTRVLLKHGKKGGTVIIHYFSDEELNDLIKKIVRE
jgi:ParB family transcriptional regulator, chromosome partitioning protein